MNCAQNFYETAESADLSYAREAAYGAIPKALIKKHLKSMKGASLSVLMALLHDTDCYYRLNFKRSKRARYLEDMTGLSRNAIATALKRLAELHIIGGYTPGKGSEYNDFYLTFDVDHFQKEECCLEQIELYDYFRHMAMKRGDDITLDFFTPEMSKNETPMPNNCDRDAQNLGNITITLKDTPDNKFFVGTHEDQFIHSFNEFCIKDDAEYRTSTLAHLKRIAMMYRCSTHELATCLDIACEKGKQGNVFYVAGILKNRAKDRKSGAWPCGKPSWSVVNDSVKRYMETVKDYVTWNFDSKTGVLSYKMIDHAEERLTKLHVEEYLPDQVQKDTRQKITVRAEIV